MKKLAVAGDVEIIRNVYSEDIIPELMTIQPLLHDSDILVVHFDGFFYRYPDEYLQQLMTNIHQLSLQFDGNILVSNGLFNERHQSILKKNIGKYDQLLLEQAGLLQELLARPNIYFFDFKKLLLQLGIANAYNFKLGFLYQMPYTKALIGALAGELGQHLRFLAAPEKKAIFLDCDNTLWKGILGEDGLTGIQCNKNAQGVLYYHFQQFLLEKKGEGFILGLCSKNNENDVKEAFETLNMPLKWEDFVIKKVNWENKATNLLHAAQELNLGLSSFIFIDDNEFELQSIHSLLPEIKTFKITDEFTDFLEMAADFSFKRKRITDEDVKKTEQYYAESERNEMKAKVGSFEDYVKSLGIRLNITINNKEDLPRLAQLTEKTNQFNFHKEIFSVRQMEEFIENGNLVYGIRVSDKFGDYGLVGLILVQLEGDKGTMRNFLMSCRALGRSVESSFFQYVLDSLSEKKIELIHVNFKETQKNTPAKTFYEEIRHFATS